MGVSVCTSERARVRVCVRARCVCVGACVGRHRSFFSCTGRANDLCALSGDSLRELDREKRALSLSARDFRTAAAAPPPVAPKEPAMAIRPHGCLFRVLKHHPDEEKARERRGVDSGRAPALRSHRAPRQLVFRGAAATSLGGNPFTDT